MNRAEDGGSLQIAVAQIANAPGRLNANLALHLQLIGQARRAGAGLLVFPELSLTGYAPNPDCADCAALALPRNAAVFAQLAAGAGAMAVSLGFIERGDDGRHYNAQILLTGQRHAVHRKLNLPGYGNLREDRVYARGDALALGELKLGELKLGESGSHWRIATLICADHWNPALPWLAAVSGANLLLAPAASARNAVDGFDNPRGWAINLSHTALTYGAPTVFANYCGKSGDADFWGGSRILDASGQELVCAHEQPALIMAEVSVADGQAARARLPTVRDSDPARVAQLLNGVLAQGLNRQSGVT